MNRRVLFTAVLTLSVTIYFFSNPFVLNPVEFISYIKYLFLPNLVLSILWGYFIHNRLYNLLECSYLLYKYKESNNVIIKIMLPIIVVFTLLHIFFLIVFIGYYTFLFTFNWDLMMKISQIYFLYYYSISLIGLIIGILFSIILSKRSFFLIKIIQLTLSLLPLTVIFILGNTNFFILNTNSSYSVLNGVENVKEQIVIKSFLIFYLFFTVIFIHLSNKLIINFMFLVASVFLLIGVNFFFSDKVVQANLFERYIQSYLSLPVNSYELSSDNEIKVLDTKIEWINNRKLQLKTTVNIIPNEYGQVELFLDEMFKLEKVSNGDNQLQFKQDKNSVNFSLESQQKVQLYYTVQYGTGLVPITKEGINLPYYFQWTPTTSFENSYKNNVDGQPTLNRKKDNCKNFKIIHLKNLDRAHVIEEPICTTLIVGEYSTFSIKDEIEVYIPIVWVSAIKYIEEHIRELNTFIHDINMDLDIDEIERIVVSPKYEFDAYTALEDYWVRDDTYFMNIYPYVDVNHFNIFQSDMEFKKQAITYNALIDQGETEEEAKIKSKNYVENLSDPIISN